MRRLVEGLTIAGILAACGGGDVATSSSTGTGGTGATGAGNPIGGSTGVTSGIGGFGEPPAEFEVTGIVVDEDGAPIADAFVLQGGKSHEPPLSTGSDGSFAITLTYPGFGIPGVVAAKQGYRAAGEEFPFDAPDGPVTLVLDRVEDTDNTGYDWQDPGEGFDPTTAFCGHCHEVFAAEWSVSGHSRAAENGKVQGLYAGVSDHDNAASCAAAGGEWKQGLTPGDPSNATMKCYLGGGVLDELNASCGGAGQLSCDDPSLPAADAPTSFGACADCHAPGIDGVAGGRNLHDATGFGYEDGVFCDVCHKVSDIDLSLPPGVGGRLILRRPTEPSQAITSDWKPLYFGPLLDVPNAFMGAAYQPDFKEAQFCAGCHQQKQAALVPGDALDPARWPDGLDVHSTYEEWLAGPYAASGTPCQFCHMPAHHDMNNTIGTSSPDNASITAGYPRPPEDIRSHRFLGPLDVYGDAPRLIDTALFTSVALSLPGGEVEATVNLSNIGCGHALPTGEPMRALILRVTAEGTGCGTRPATGGDTVYDVGGVRNRGVVGVEVSGGGTSLTWPGSGSGTGMVVRAVRPTGQFDDYPGIGFFANPALTAADKGLERHAPVGEATVVGAAGGVLTLDASLTLQAGDVVWLGDPASGPTSDGDVSRALAGAPGYAFARVHTDSAGARQVPHYRAVDIASDNRIPPGVAVQTAHRFAIDPSCSDVTVRAEVLYRPHPLGLADERGWDAKDYVIGVATETIATP